MHYVWTLMSPVLNYYNKNLSEIILTTCFCEKENILKSAILPLFACNIR